MVREVCNICGGFLVPLYVDNRKDKNNPIREWRGYARFCNNECHDLFMKRGFSAAAPGPGVPMVGGAATPGPGVPTTGRMSGGPGRGHAGAPPAAPEDRGWDTRKLTDKEAVNMQKEYMDGRGYKWLAKKYGISKASVRRAVRGETYVRHRAT